MDKSSPKYFCIVWSSIHLVCGAGQIAREVFKTCTLLSFLNFPQIYHASEALFVRLTKQHSPVSFLEDLESSSLNLPRTVRVRVTVGVEL